MNHADHWVLAIQERCQPFRGGAIFPMKQAGTRTTGRGLSDASNQIAHALNLGGMNVFGQLKVTGNPACMVCGCGQRCPMSALPWIFGDDTEVTPKQPYITEEAKCDLCGQ